MKYYHHEIIMRPMRPIDCFLLVCMYSARIFYDARISMKGNECRCPRHALTRVHAHITIRTHAATPTRRIATTHFRVWSACHFSSRPPLYSNQFLRTAGAPLCGRVFFCCRHQNISHFRYGMRNNLRPIRRMRCS